MDSTDTPPTTTSAGFMIPLLISIAAIVVISLALVLYHLLLVKYCMRRRIINNNNRPSQYQIPADGDNKLGIGVEERILDTIPILSYSTNKTELFRVDQSECVVCLGELEDGDLVRLLPNCKHSFHILCIDQWFLAHSSCPVCRSPIVAAAVNLSMENEERDEDSTGEVTECSSRIESTGLLRHCSSFALPSEGNKSTGLKRWLSADQSLVRINIERGIEKGCSSSSNAVLGGSGSYRVQLC